MRKLSLRTKLLFFFIVLAIIPLLVASWNMITITQDELKSAANEELSATAVQIANDIDNTYANTWAAPLLLIKDAIDNENLGPAEKLSVMSFGVQEIPDIVELQLTVEGMPNPFPVVREDFNLRLKEKGLDANEILPLAPEKVDVLKKPGTVALGELEYIEQADVWLTSMVAALNSPLMGREAVLSARVNLEYLRDKIARNPFSQINKVSLIDEGGFNAFDKTRKPVGQTDLLKEALQLLEKGSRASGVHHYTGASGEEMLGAYAIPAHMKWAVIVEKPKAEAYAAVAKMRRSLLIWALAGFITAAVTAIIVAFSLTNPLNRLTKAARTLISGDFNVPIEGKSRGDEIGELSNAFIKMVNELKHYIAVLTETTIQKERAESELRLGKNIQESFIPKTFPQIEGLEMFGRCDPAKEVGGDFFDYVRLDENKWGIVIGDVSGKGVPAALFMVMCRTLFQMLSFQSDSPKETLELLNRRLVQLDPSGNMFITVFYAIIDTKKKIITYSTAGHNMPFVKFETVNPNFVMLPRMKTLVAGMMDEIHLQETELKLNPGDTLVLYTDGMTEAVNLSDKDYGEDGMIKLLETIKDASAKEICGQSIQVVKDFQAGRPQFDDMTMFVVKVG